TGRYANYTACSTKVSPQVTYPITVTNGLLTYAGDQCGIWVDWNHDFDFADAGETIPVTGTPGIGPYTANITPPVNAVKGLTRMRIRIMWAGTLSSCGTTSYGEVEDYSLYVGTPGLWVGGTQFKYLCRYTRKRTILSTGRRYLQLPGSANQRWRGCNYSARFFSECQW
ncbi:MAG: GEVED domain-containing protein, partial [Bacteroidales bacterium]|nr:GEVED domain-containing protein [Bacteroidales bacterium]